MASSAIFRDNGRDGLSYLADQPIKYVPIGDKIELNLGPDPSDLRADRAEGPSRDELWMLAQRKPNVCAGRLDDGAAAIEPNWVR